MIVADGEAARTRAAQIISQGGVIAFRTDTFYGLGADPFNEAAIKRVRELKGREGNKPILLLISDEQQISRFISKQSSIFTEVAKRFWPGPLTIVGPAQDELLNELTAGSRTIGLRLTGDENARAIVRACGGALTATSANLSSQSEARSASEVASYFATGIDLIIDGGEVSATRPSTVIDLSGTEPRIVREGVIKATELEKFLY
ncbi:MAG TPA: L-threonylcarbamoyladenylate synthase [Pyrinomonadaceae bacterium]|nr:L-threonylcarbamoyladenylate synthase [Pyrinomonadaceae bacterium]